MSFAAAVRTCFQKYATFEGRAKRSEFWWWMLFQTLVTGVIALIGGVFVIAASVGNPGGQANGPLLVIGMIFYVVAIVVALGLLVPTYAVGCRRLHDRGMSGWLQLLTLVPCGNIVLLVFWVMGGTPGANTYGEKTS
ncbi:unannotated protein [freshwater metagenome]|uniref:Unannotated protein n=1 Tax=freshwater metagenome TaxID=449393 RepID=A0A6J6LW64_9ZZZZ|nr:DUF805 domain-containing protein [Actinomycetota bacterium]MSW10513.1 DUF805 domain-containing protein [Actinomycetota bacterium]MSY40782.1 DUF805 domain-containing protein [Actinomycetota bacterium]MSY97548.1 DUF805 domain-containing protein [Actinomycetota bacterium]